MMTERNLPSMPKVTLGRSGIVSTKLGIGTANWPHHVSYEETITMLQAALDAGIRHIDTAPVYQTEDIIGKALQEIDLPADIVLATKAGSYSEPSLGSTGKDYRADTIYRSVERSLQRMGVDHIHILHIHDPRAEHMSQVFAPDGALAALQNLKDQGVIGAIGMGTVVLSCLQAAAESGAFDILQIFHTYTLLNQSAEETIFPTCRQANISILNSAPFAGFILATGAVPGAEYNYSPASPEVIAATQRLEEVCAQK
ncbi:MAG: aldo/keto reductase, partial [Anaerolineales bacterium]